MSHIHGLQTNGQTTVAIGYMRGGHPVRFATHNICVLSSRAGTRVSSLDPVG